MAAIFADGFENQVVGSFWAKTGPGTAVPTRAIEHSGTQSVSLAVSSAYPWNVSLSHDFGVEQSGSVSVYVHTNLAGSTASAELGITRANGDVANIQQLPSGGFQTRVCTGARQTSLCENGVFFSGSNLIWHRFEIQTDSHGITVKLDGVAVVSDPSIEAFQSVDLGVWGGPSGSADYDDFTAVVTPVVTDGFESQSISSFWTKTGPGTAVPTRAIEHSGTQSVALAVSSTYPWNVSLSHDFGVEQSGSVSVYVHTNLAGSGASADLSITRTNGDSVNIQQLPSGGFQARVCSGTDRASICGTGLFFSGSNVIWHQFEIRTGPEGVTVNLDGVTVLTDPSVATFRSVGLGVWGGPSGSADYDDFSAIL